MNLYRMILVACMVLFPIVGVSQDTTRMLVPKSMLTQEQLASMKTQDFTPESMSKWAGAGKEVGVAVNSALGAVTEQAGKFGETKIGKITIFLVVWKVIGNELMDYVIAFFLFVTGLGTLIWSMKRHLPRTVLAKEHVNEKGKVETRDYTETKGNEDAVVIHWGMIIALTLLCVMIAI